jgi:di/tricarboxylate transporter
MLAKFTLLIDNNTGMTLMIIILSITILLFVWGKFSPDIVALLSMISLYVFGILSLDETLSGFSNSTVIMIASLFIIGEGMSQTGWTALAGKKLISMAKKSATKLLLIVTMGAGLLSGFVSNTGTVATLIPVTISSAWSIGTLPSKVLMPMAFGSNTGGLLTLTGTPPNIIVNNAMEQGGIEGFSFFEFALIGLPLLIVGLFYFRYIGHKLLPERKTNNKPIDVNSTLHQWIENYQIQESYYKLRIRSISPMINTKIGDWNIEDEFNVNIIRIKRRHPNVLKGIQPYMEFPTGDTDLYYHDIITVKGETQDINRMMIRFRLGLLPQEPVKDEMRYNLINQEVGMAEVIVSPKSHLVGREIRVVDFFKRFGIQLLSTSSQRRPFTEEVMYVKSGDSFIIRGQWGDIEKLKEQHKHIVICGSPEGMVKSIDDITWKSYIALGSLLTMIALLVFNVVPGAIASLIGAGIVILTRCVTIEKAYKGISWMSVIMIAAMIPMGLALQKTGTAKFFADSLIDLLGGKNPLFLLGGVFLITTLFSQFINNSATAVLMVPIVLLAAQTLDISAKPLMITVAISASTAFLTPIGTTTNAMVIAAGGYKFYDYFKVGFPLLLLFLITTIVLVPIIWPF